MARCVDAMILPDHLAPLPLPVPDEGAMAARIPDGGFISDSDIVKVVLGTTGSLPVEGLPAEDFDSFAGRADVRYEPSTPFHAIFPANEAEGGEEVGNTANPVVPAAVAAAEGPVAARSIPQVRTWSPAAALLAPVTVSATGTAAATASPVSPSPSPSPAAAATIPAVSKAAPTPDAPAVHPVFELYPMRRAAPPQPSLHGTAIGTASVAVGALATGGKMDAEEHFGEDSPGSDRWWLLGLGVAIVAILFSGAFADFALREAGRRKDLIPERAQVIPREVPHVPPGASSRVTPAPAPAASESAATRPTTTPKVSLVTPGAAE